jgi:hypothetical protein
MHGKTVSTSLVDTVEGEISDLGIREIRRSA